MIRPIVKVEMTGLVPRPTRSSPEPNALIIHVEGIQRIDDNMCFCVAGDVPWNSLDNSSTWQLDCWIMRNGTKFKIQWDILSTWNLGNKPWGEVRFMVEFDYSIAPGVLSDAIHAETTRARVPVWVQGFLHDSFKANHNPLPHLRALFPGVWEFSPADKQSGRKFGLVLLDGVEIWADLLLRCNASVI